MTTPSNTVLPRRSRLRRLAIGRPMPSERLGGQLLSKRLAFPIFSSDALSSVAYASEAALAVLVAVSLSSRGALPWISLAVAGLLLVVVASYRQTIAAYPSGGGAYVVAGENLGPLAGLVAAASLLIDYTLTVAVSVAAGILAISSMATSLDAYVLELSIVVLIVLAVANLRGLRETGRTFAAPTCLFLASLGACLLVGLGRGLVSGWPAADVPDPLPTGAAAGVGLVILARAFASGCSALTGVEAIANGVGAFRRPQARNAIVTITVMGAVAVAAFLGVSVLAWKTGAGPSQTTSVLAQVGRASFGTTPAGTAAFYVLQVSTFAVLILAANTAYQGFPRLAALLARDGFAPRQLQNLGDRLVLSNGIVLLSVAAGLLVALSNAELDQLIHLYLLGVFTAFTLSQAGMVRHWMRRLRHGATPRAVLPGLALNGVGAVATGAVSVIVVATKFTQGAWMVVVAIPILVAVCLSVRRHYRINDRAIAPCVPRLAHTTRAVDIVVLVDDVDAPHSRYALDYARAVARHPVETLAIVRDDSGGPTRRENPRSGASPHRTIPASGDPAGALVAELHRRRRSSAGPVTLVIPESFEHPSLAAAVGPRSAFALKARLLGHPEIVITDVALLRGTVLPEPGKMEIMSIVLVAELTEPTLRALEYVRSLNGRDVRAVHIALGEDTDRSLADAWSHAGVPVPLEVLASPYRDLGGPLLELVRQITADPDAVCNVVLPEVVATHWRHRVLHNQRGLFIKRLLLFEPRTVVTSVPYRIDGDQPRAAHSGRAASV